VRIVIPRWQDVSAHGTNAGFAKFALDDEAAFRVFFLLTATPPLVRAVMSAFAQFAS
jgi:hypothetical protein